MDNEIRFPKLFFNVQMKKKKKTLVVAINHKLHIIILLISVNLIIIKLLSFIVNINYISQTD